METRKTGMLLAASLAAAMLTGPAAGAGNGVQPGFGDELQRCVAALRPAVTDAGAHAVRHTVTDVHVRGLWREFTIESALRARDGSELRRMTSHCKAERWGLQTRLEPPRS
jgi:hypothetical protein